MVNVFVDMDGVLADFDRAFETKFNKQTPSKMGVTDTEMWALINTMPDFFLEIPPYEGAQEFWYNIQAMLGPENQAILTAASKSYYSAIAIQKKQWITRHIDPRAWVLPTYGASSKTLFLQEPGDILIDDFQRNCERWEEAGGRAILHTSFEDSFNQLVKLIS